MAYFLRLPTFHSKGGALSVIDEGGLPFDIKRVFYIYESAHDARRGSHRHKKTRQAAVCISGSCIIDTDDSEKQDFWTLDEPDKCLILEPEDWHVMHTFAPGTVLLVLASMKFDPADYIFESYR